jgi:hypothetical protein
MSRLRRDDDDTVTLDIEQVAADVHGARLDERPEQHTDEVLDAARLLDEPPAAGDLNALLVAKDPRRHTPRLTLGLAGLVLVAGGFVGGVQVEKSHNHGGGSGTTGRSGFARRGTGFGARGTGGSGGGLAGGGIAVGTVKLVDGSTIYLQEANGQIATVTTSRSTTVSVSHSGTVSQLTPGSTVVVSGSPGANGTLQANSITQGGGGLGGFGAAGGAASGGGTGGAAGGGAAGTG